MPVYTVDAGLEKLGKEVVLKHYPMLGHVKIQYMFRSEASISDEKVIAGRCVKVDDRNRAIHDYDFIIEIAQDVWAEATEDFRYALMDHELGHAGIRMDPDNPTDPLYDEKTNRPKTYIHTHDIEEFEDVLERHGAYHKGLRSFLDAFTASKMKKKDTKKTPDPELGESDA